MNIENKLKSMLRLYMKKNALAYNVDFNIMYLTKK